MMISHMLMMTRRTLVMDDLTQVDNLLTQDDDNPAFTTVIYRSQMKIQIGNLALHIPRALQLKNQS